MKASSNRILRLEPAAGVFTRWQLTRDAYPQGLALQANGNLWWGDESRVELARLVPGSNRMTAYALPAGTAPEMIALNRGQVWYTVSTNGAFGMLDPALAVGTSAVVARKTPQVTPACRDLGAGITCAVTASTGTLAWSPNSYPGAASGSGRMIYHCHAGASPWGIATGAGSLWIVDQGHQMLLRVPEPGPATLTPTPSPTEVSTSTPTGTTRAELTWSAITGATLYRTWHNSADPYFTPGGTPAQENGSLSFTHSSTTADPANYYYVVRAANASPAESVNSNRTGKFIFPLVPGSQ